MVVKKEPAEARVPAAKPKTNAPSKAQGNASKEGYKDAKKAMWDFRKATAWQVHRWPLEKRIVEERTKIHLPRTYRAKAGEDVKKVWPGTDINQFVHQHYMQEWDAENVPEGSANFVAGELGVLLRR